MKRDRLYDRWFLVWSGVMALTLLGIRFLPIGALRSACVSVLVLLGIPFPIFLLIGVLNWRDRVAARRADTLE
jgi:hypothetical protein